MSFQTHEEYLATVPAEIRGRLERIQLEVERCVPGALRCISYNIPAFRQQRVFMYFATFKKHIGIYPPVMEDKALVSETAPFRGPKGNLTFRHDRELPLELIGRIAVALASQYAAGRAGQKK